MTPLARWIGREIRLCALSSIRSMTLILCGVLTTFAILHQARLASYLIVLGAAIGGEALGVWLRRLEEAPLRAELAAVIEENHRLAEAVLALDGSEANLRLVRGGGA